MSDVTEQIKEKISVADLLGEYLKLEKSGANYKALCPFHNEKTPSFMVNAERNFWYCFGCQKGGDIFSFLMEMEGIEFYEALKRLAEKANVQLPKKYSNLDNQKNDRQSRLFEVTELATKFFQAHLGQTERGKEMLEYLTKRNVSEAELKLFRLGYAPTGWRSLIDYLLKNNFSLSDLALAGLTVDKSITGGSSQAAYDRFRDRIMFPVMDVMGRVVGFSARVSPTADEKTAKYINTPETRLYEKSKVLYGLFQAKTEIKKQNFVIIVEGNLDVIASWRSGLGNIVAISGTALTKEHVALLKRYTIRFKLCFDMDEAGQKATQKSIQTCLEEGMETEIIILPKGYKDVSDIVKADPTLWQQAVENSLPVMEYYFTMAARGADLSDVKTKRDISQKMLNIIKDIADPIEQGYWLNKLSTLVGVEEKILEEVLEKFSFDKKLSKRTMQKKPTIMRKQRKVLLMERLLGLFSLFNQELEAHKEEIEADIFEGEYALIWQQLKNKQIAQDDPSVQKFELAIKYSYDESSGFSENLLEPLKEWQAVLIQLRLEKLKERAKNIVFDIKKAEQSEDDETVNKLTEEFIEISRLLKGNE